MDDMRHTMAGSRFGRAAAIFHRCAAFAGACGVVVAVGIAAQYGSGEARATETLQSGPPVAVTTATAVAATATPSAATPATVTHADPQPASADHAIGPEPARGWVRLPGHVVPVLSRAQTVLFSDPFAKQGSTLGSDGRMTLTITLKRDDEAGFERYLRDVYDPASAHFRHFWSQARLSQQFGPSRRSYQTVVNYLRQRGFTLVEGSKNRLTVTVRGTRDAAQAAFAINVSDYSLGDARFYANDADPALPKSVARHVSAISGLSDLARPATVKVDEALNYCGAVSNVAGAIIIFPLLALFARITGAICTGIQIGRNPSPSLNYCGLVVFGGIWGDIIQAACSGVQIGQSPGFGAGQSSGSKSGANPHGGVGGGSASKRVAAQRRPSSRGPVSAKAQTRAVTPPDGTGQTIGLLEFDTFARTDVTDYLRLIGADPNQINNLSEVHVNGGVAAPGSNQDEVLLDIAVVLSTAPAAKVVVYDAPFDGTTAGYVALFNQMINDKVTVISNSWASCEDQVSQAEAQAIDTVLQTAAASGISVFNGTGDSGPVCLDGAKSVIAVPADSPNATAVGGSTLTLGTGYVYSGETWWNGSAATPASGQAGYGVSRYFSRPSYQSVVNGGANRSVPDVVVDADPASGYILCEASNGGCPNGQLYGGTSASAPTWAAFAALLNQDAGKALGALNPLIYPLANTNAFHGAASMGSDFAHVGLGSPNLDLLYLSLTHQTAGAVDPAASTLTYNATIRSTGQDAPLLPDPADGSTAAVYVVTLRDSNGNTVGGKTVLLTAVNGNATITAVSTVTSVADGTAVFKITDATPENVTLTATDTTDGLTLTPAGLAVFGVPSATGASISANPTTDTADGQTSATVTVTLKDSLSRPTPGKTVTLSNGGSNAAMQGPVPGVTDANGQIQFAVTDFVAETATFTAVDVTDGNLPVPGSAQVVFSNAASNTCNFGVPPTPGAGYTATAFITGIPATTVLNYANTNFNCAGGINPTFESSGAILEVDFYNGSLYQLGASGGAVSTSLLLTTLHPAISSLVYGKDGSLYASQSGEGGYIAQLDPATGAQLRIVASNLTCPSGLAVDPLSGDLFFDDECTHAGTDDPTIYRIIDPANTDTGNPTSVVAYAKLPSTPSGGMAFAPNGTLYAVSGYYYTTTAQVMQVSATNATSVTVTPVTGITSDFGIAIGQTNADGSAQSLIVEPAGTLSEIPIATPSTPTVIATGGPGVGVIGPDGCMYSAKTTTIYRVAAAAGGCSFTPTSPAPAINLTPATVAPNPAQGSAQTFTATLRNVTPSSGVPVMFTVEGVNEQIKLVDTDSNGKAVLSYTAAFAGTDKVTASAAPSTTTLTSNTVPVTWTAGKHVSVLSLNASPQGAIVNQPVTLVASLADGSASPVAALSGQAVSFTLGGATCTATTGTTGLASCAITPTQAGSTTLTASFAGGSQVTAATGSIGFRVSVAPAPPPTVTIAVSPTSIAAGGAATLTWSSTNASACTASGAWSGTQSASGTQTVTATSSGNFSYTLSCTGDGGTAAATAVLSATLVAITVTAHSGGGAITWPFAALLALLVLLRLRASARRDSRSAPRYLNLLGAAAAVMALTGFGCSRAADTAEPASWLDPFYVGVRVGNMHTRDSAGAVDEGLANRGFGNVQATTDAAATAGTFYVGYELAAHADVEFAYTHRSATSARLAGTIPSEAGVVPLLEDTAGLLRGYGNVFAVSFRPRIEIFPKVMLDPRIGPYFWSTKVTVTGAGQSVDATHEGGGIAVGIGAAYRIWRGLEFGVGADYFRGTPSNHATLYSGSLEWRFGR
jgi:hypothetical protein